MSVAWELSPGDTSVFVTASDSILFESGQTVADITIQVRELLDNNKYLLVYLHTLYT